jgi:hypothetical protein
MAAAAALAADIASKSPLAVAGTKQVLLHTRSVHCSTAGAHNPQLSQQLACLASHSAPCHAFVSHRDGCGGVAAGLRHVALWNSAYLLSEDIARVVTHGQGKKQAPVFSKL